MQTYKIETTVPRDGTLKIEGHPFQAGEQVEILVRNQEDQELDSADRYPLRGTPIRYENPFDGVSESDWDAQG